MHFQTILLPGFFAAATMALALPDADMSDLSHGLQETTLFKRDDVLGPRDLELADAHGVNLTEMYRHSLMKRDDGDHVTIWVARDYIAHDDDENDSTEAVNDDEDVDEEGLTKRQSVRVGKEVFFHRGSLGGKTCMKHKRQNHTGPNGPTSGGVQAIYRWGDREAGSFMLHSRWQNLVIAGSNKGANALYRARRASGFPELHIGSRDIRNDADWTQKRARSFNGVWRASSKGGETCQLLMRANYELIRTKYNV
ncbi:hypothetical protein D7B24_008663 [Verticillium nonalfalfae]|uniref:Ecp2 effector protein domain-containing protein n=1 Tax=Verticillium nonalfalfae TaxID=1051616 RepID=A0A3M9YJZ0_9PEZI|nr:uncharacterized protein D7B24_008663 [Verticillium nonalfalfae]RNJ60282.1 hypothetical protein D7B24_008663 [Verticillium nonalfalfae]